MQFCNLKQKVSLKAVITSLSKIAKTKITKYFFPRGAFSNSLHKNRSLAKKQKKPVEKRTKVC